MEDGQDPKLDEKATSREQYKGKGQVKRNPQIIMMGSIILLLILALIFIATPLKGMFIPAKRCYRAFSSHWAGSSYPCGVY